MTNQTEAQQLEDMLSTIQSRLGGGDLPCTNLDANGRACTQQHEGKFDRVGRPIFYFATDCRIVETFCPACLAYWHVAVARNNLITFRRFAASEAPFRPLSTLELMKLQGFAQPETVDGKVVGRSERLDILYNLVEQVDQNQHGKCPNIGQCKLCDALADAKLLLKERKYQPQLTEGVR